MRANRRELGFITVIMKDGREKLAGRKALIVDRRAGRATLRASRCVEGQ